MPEISYDDGEKYVGEVKGSQRHGQGTYTDKEGRSYTGVWDEDDLNGKGSYSAPDGESYEGEFQSCEKHGKGLFRFSNGETYEGNFDHDTMKGFGKYTFKSGAVYEGNWEDGERCGYGVLTEPNGGKYEGNWAHDKCHGPGKWTDANGNVFEGNFVDGKKQGKGVQRYNDGRVFEGEWDGDKKKSGILKDPSGCEYKMEFDANGNVIKQEQTKGPSKPLGPLPEETGVGKGKGGAPAPPATPPPEPKPEPKPAPPAEPPKPPAPTPAPATPAPSSEGSGAAGAGAGGAGAGGEGKSRVRAKSVMQPGNLAALPAGWRGPYAVCLLGAAKVGKSALANMFVQNLFITEYDATLEDQYMVRVDLDNVFVLDLKDVGGAPDFASIREEFIPKCKGFILCYSIVDRDSFTQLKDFRDTVIRLKGGNAPMLLAATQSDKGKVYNRAVTVEEGQALATEWGIPFLETSAKEHQNVDEVFQQAVLLCDK